MLGWTVQGWAEAAQQLRQRTRCERRPSWRLAHARIAPPALLLLLCLTFSSNSRRRHTQQSPARHSCPQRPPHRATPVAFSLPEKL